MLKSQERMLQRPGNHYTADEVIESKKQRLQRIASMNTNESPSKLFAECLLELYAKLDNGKGES